MDIFVISSESCARRRNFQQFVAAKGHRTQRLGTQTPWSELEEPALGAVFFDEGAPQLAARVRAAHEQVRYLSIPFVVVTREEKLVVQNELRSAGAEFLCDPSTPDALIFKELHARCRVQALAPEVRHHLAQPFVTSVRQTLGDMVGVDVAVHSLYQREEVVALGDVDVMLVLCAPLQGVLMLSFSHVAAAGLTRRVFAEVASEFKGSLIPDCMGEITNVVAGQCKALLAGTPYHSAFTTPTVSTDAKRAKLHQAANILTIAFACELGGFALQVCKHR